MEIKRLILLGTTGSGKSRFGNKFSKKHIFKESEEPDSCTKGIYRAYNDYGVEIIDTQGLNDTNDEDKKGLTSIFNEIKENKPNILAYVQNSSDKRFGKYSKNAITKICQMFNTKSVWNNFIVIFTFADSISKENREKVATNFIEKILDVVKECYKNKNDSVPLPKKLNYFFVELHDTDKNPLDEDTENNFREILKLIHIMPPISYIVDKMIVETKIRHCKESVKIYDKYITDKYGAIKEVAARTAATTGCLCSSYATPFATTSALIGAGITGIAPIIIVGGTAFFAVSFLTTQLVNKVKKIDFRYKVDDKKKYKDFIEFDEIIFVYHDGTQSEPQRINIDKYTEEIDK